jgi:TonB-dependent starch-binding outer membrane protein SusC
MKNLRMRCLFGKRGMNLKLRKMKLTLLFSFLIFSSVWAETYSQTTKLNLNLKNATVQNFIKEIEDQTGYLFLYQDEVVDKNQRITIEAKDETLENVLKKFEDRFL